MASSLLSMIIHDTNKVKESSTLMINSVVADVDRSNPCPEI